MTRAYQDPAEIRESLGRNTMREYHTVSTFRGLLSIASEWSIIIATAILCEMYFSWPLYIGCVLLIGARLLALGFIMHEAVHHLVSRNRWINDWFAELFCAWPLFVSLRSYSVKHLAHHAWLNTDEDPDYTAKSNPDWRYPMKQFKFLKIILTQLSGLGVFETLKLMSSAQMKVKKKKTPLWYHLLRIAYYLAIIASFVVLGQGRLLLLYWIIPFLTWTQVANRLRRVSEHSAIEGKSPALQTRTTIHGFLGRTFFAPRNIAYHNEHHLYPGVPSYHLPKVHEELLKVPEVKESLHFSQGYAEVYDECIVKT